MNDSDIIITFFISLIAGFIFGYYTRKWISK